jgi:hypothetical protein
VQIAPETCRANDERNKECSVHLVGPELNIYVTKMYGTTNIKFNYQMYAFQFRALKNVETFVVNHKSTMIKYALSYINIHLQVPETVRGILIDEQAYFAIIHLLVYYISVIKSIYLILQIFLNMQILVLRNRSKFLVFKKTRNLKANG